MATLARARIKTVEHLPDWTRCCDAPLTKVAEAMEYFTVDISRKRSGEGKCIFCESPHGVLTQVIGFFPDEQWINLEIIDLDEGTFGAGEPSEGGAEWKE